MYVYMYIYAYYTYVGKKSLSDNSPAHAHEDITSDISTRLYIIRAIYHPNRCSSEKSRDKNKCSFVQFDEKTYVRSPGKSFPQAVDKPVENYVK